MISKSNYELVKQAIKIHSRLKGRTYLIMYKVNMEHDSNIMETPILEENFWHLVGCRIDDSLNMSSEEKHQLYLKCANGDDISNSLIYTRQPQDVAKKANVVIGVFDFIRNAKSIRLCHTNGTPEAVMFKVGAGSNNGVIGYSDEDEGMIPKTAQQKSVFKIKADANDKIYLILSKPYGNAKYDTVEYFVSKKIFPDILSEIPLEILFDKNIFKIC